MNVISRTEPHSSAAVDPGQRLASGVVVVWDARNDRAELVAGIAAEAGARVMRTQGETGSLPGCGRADVALVAMGVEAGARASTLEKVRGLRDCCQVVLGYEDGVGGWPLGTRAQALLSGSTRLLDSAADGFGSELRARLTEALQVARRRREDEQQLRERMGSCGIVGESVPMMRVFEWVARISRFSDFCVLLEGETGTGKDLLARALHRLDPRRCEGPLVAVNCAALAKTLAESELFGHRRGAFTGAERDRPGLVRAADGGVLFLDEIGELDLELQAKLLHVLQDGRVMGVGEERDVPVNVRVVAATHRDLGQMVAQGRFREDLLHRLEVLSVEVPPLRDRRDDVKPLVAFFLEKYRALAAGARLEACPEFLDALGQLELRGNVRELENIVRRAMAQKEDEAPLGLADLPRDLWRRLAARSEDGLAAHPEPSEQLLDESGFCLARALERHERALVALAVRRAQGNQSEAARLLGITPRSVYTKLRKHQLDKRRRA